VKLNVVGCSPAWPNANGAHSGYLVEGKEKLLLDCGPGVLARLRATGRWPDVGAIVITHFHLDHWGDLVPWVWGAAYLDGDEGRPGRPELWVPPAGTRRLEDFGGLLGFARMFENTFRISEYEHERPFEAGGFTVTAVRLPHYRLDAYGLRVTDGSSSLAYSADSGPSDDLVELARNADLFVCEATLARGELDGTPRGHLTLEEARDAFEQSGARRLLVTHRPSELPTGPEFELAYDGMVCAV
jgi:ribonuclease BN (tRNA processing enzyme)